MKPYRKLPLSIAVAACLGTGVAQADVHDQDGWDGYFAGFYKAAEVFYIEGNLSTTEREIDLSIEKDVSVSKDVAYSGEVEIYGRILVDALSMALSDVKQASQNNSADNNGQNNDASIDGDALGQSSGNIGVNVAAGDNNVQQNSAALAATDAAFTFGSADAETFLSQDAEFNRTFNFGVNNDAHVVDNALQGASGNIGVNVAAGNNNIQANQLAAAVTTGSMGEATASSQQRTDTNHTSNWGIYELVPYDVELDVALEGGYSGTSDQIGNVYPDTWDGVGHPNGSQTGHIDLDSAAQGAQDLNGDGGALAFNEAGDIALSGTITGQILVPVLAFNTNSAHLSDNALHGASGNIGVNVAAGTNNLQGNALAMTYLQAPLGGGTGGDTGEPQ